MEIFQIKTKLIQLSIIIILLVLISLSLCFAGWDNTKPAESDGVYTWPTSIKANWDALEAAFGVDLANVSTGGTVNVYNVKNPSYGAVGDGSTDDSTSIQAAIDAAEAAGGGIIFFPLGEYSIQTTLVINKAQGVRFVGVGNVGDWRGGGTDSNTGTVLAWDGANDGTLLQIRGCRIITFENIHFAGKDSSDNTKTDILVSIKNHTDGDACGNIYFTNCNFMHAEAGIQCADASGDNNASDLTLKDCAFKNCITGFLVKNIQGINYLANYISATDCTNVFYFENGGNFTVNRVYAVDCNWIIKLGAGGRNVSIININGGNGESSGTIRSGIIYCAAPSDACTYIVNVTGFSHTCESGAGSLTPYASTYTNVLDDGVVAIFNGCMINAYDFATLAGDSVTDDRANLVLNNCKFWEGNVTINDFINIPADNGAHDGGNNQGTVMTDSSQSWVADELIGRVIINTTDKSYGTITDNDTTTITVASLTSGTDDDWDTNDSFIITQPFFHVEIVNCYDNVGRALNYSMPVRFLVDDATPYVSIGKLFVTSPSDNYDITDFDYGASETPYDGQIIIIIGGETSVAATVKHDVSKINLVGGVDFAISEGDVIVLIYRNGEWYEVSRANNTIA